MENVNWLTDWFAARCDGEWESDFGITIETVNNPGWMVRIDLDGTGLDPSSFRGVAEQRSPSDWVECKVEDGAFLGGGGVGNLDEVVGVFRAWVEGKGVTGARRPPPPYRSAPVKPPHRGGDWGGRGHRSGRPRRKG